jgi:hypothetical protein
MASEKIRELATRVDQALFALDDAIADLRHECQRQCGTVARSRYGEPPQAVAHIDALLHSAISAKHQIAAAARIPDFRAFRIDQNLDQ